MFSLSRHKVKKHHLFPPSPSKFSTTTSESLPFKAKQSKAKGTNKHPHRPQQTPLISTTNSTQTLPSILPPFAARSNQPPPNPQSASTYTTLLPTYLTYLLNISSTHSLEKRKPGRLCVSGPFSEPLRTCNLLQAGGK